MTIYYVDTAAADDNGAGTSEATAWKTIAKVNASSFSAGDSILFKRGCTWREQLTVPSSGESGNPITFGAYGSGEKPVISKGTLASIWASDSGSGAVITGTNTLEVVTDNYNHGTKSAKWVFDGTNQDCYIKKTISDQGDIYVRAYFYHNSGFEAGAAYQYNPILTITDGSTVVGYVRLGTAASTTQFKFVVYCGATAIYSGTANEVPIGAWYYIEYHFKAGTGADGGAEFWFNGTSKGSNFTLDKHTLAIDGVWIGSTNDVGGGQFKSGSTMYVDDVKFDTSPIGAWGGGAASEETGGIFSSGFEDETTTFTNPDDFGITGVANVWNASMGSTTVVLFNGVVGTLEASKAALTAPLEWYASGGILSVYSTVNPTTTYTAPGIEGVTGNYVIDTNGKDYLVLTDLDLRHAKINIVKAYTGSNLTLTNICVSWSGGAAYDIETTGTNTITNCTVNHTFNNGQGFLLAAGTNNVSGGSANDTDGPGISTTGTAIANVSGFISTNGRAYNGHGYAAHDTSTFNLSYSVAYGNTWSGFGSATGAGGSLYNNVFYNNNLGNISPQGGICLNTSGSWTLKNNISFSNTALDIYVSASATVDIDYNDFYSSPATVLNWHGTQYNFADWKTNSGQDAHSLNADPKFRSTTDFHLLPTSPCIGAGTDVGLTTDFAGMTVPHPARATPSIGAYEFYGGGGGMKMGLGMGL